MMYLKQWKKMRPLPLRPLDLWAAFDTMDHDLLLNRLTSWFWIDGNALGWLNSYLIDRFQCTNIKDIISNPFEFVFGVLQGSILGPLLFIMYTSSLSCVLSKFQSISHHLYTDDTQVYNSFKTSNFNLSLVNLPKSLYSA